jgi:hypothetical protein
MNFWSFKAAALRVSLMSDLKSVGSTHVQRQKKEATSFIFALYFGGYMVLNKTSQVKREK